MNERKPIFFTSDWHIGHKRVIEFDNRPFKDLEDMHESLIRNYNSTVPPNGICYFLGDVGLCKGEEVSKVINRLHGTKVLILGNHDKNIHAMYKAGFDVVLNAGIFYIGNKRFSMSHCPLPGIPREDVSNMRGAKEGENWHGEFKNTMFTNHDLTVDFHLHGHIHSDNNVKPRSTDRQYDVGVRSNKYRPVSLSTIESWATFETQKKTH
jgi:calcineurin-like phosphoesterase family protein